MQKPIKTDSGIYLLELHLSESMIIDSKRFRHLHLEKGYYYYSGSAQKNLSYRINRHLKKDKTIHWHIDLLTSRPECTVTKFWIIENMDKSGECRLVERLVKEFGLKPAVRNFGNSDCSRCISHLLESGVNPLSGFSV